MSPELGKYPVRTRAGEYSGQKAEKFSDQTKNSFQWPLFATRALLLRAFLHRMNLFFRHQDPYIKAICSPKASLDCMMLLDRG